MSFEKKVPEWNAAGTEPPSSLKESGFTPGYKPPAEYFNWFWNRVSECLKELQEMKPEDIDALALSGGVMTGQGFYLNNKTGRIVNNQNGLWLRTASSDVDNNADARHLKLWNAAYQPDLSKAVAMFDSTTGKDYLLYGEHHKPTPEEIGALPISGGELSNELIVNENFQVRKSFDNIPYRSYLRPVNYALGDEYTTGMIHYINGVNNAQLIFNRSGILLRDNVNGKAYHIYGQHKKPTPEEIGASPSGHAHSASDITAGTLPVARGGTGVTTDKALGLKAYPVGSVYMSVISTSPASLFGGTWTQLKDRFLLGAGSTYTNGSTGGAATHTLTTAQIPSHSHSIHHFASVVAAGSDKTVWSLNEENSRTSTAAAKGGGEAHNNMPPYLVVYMWKRTA